MKWKLFIGYMNMNRFSLVLIVFLSTGCFESKPDIAYDIHSLIGKNIWEIEKQLGSNYTRTPPSVLSKSESVAHVIYENKRALLSINYSISTTHVYDFLLVSKKSFSNLDNFLAIGNLKSNDKGYRIELMESGNLFDRYGSVYIFPKETRQY